MTKRWLTVAAVLFVASYSWVILALSLMIWPSKVRFWFVVLLGLVVTAGLMAAAVTLLPELRRQSRKLTNVASSARKATPMLHSIDNRTRSLVQFVAQDRTRQATTPSDATAVLAVRVSSAADAVAAVAVYRQHQEMLASLVLVLDPAVVPTEAGWLEQYNTGDVTVVAGEHLVEGTASISSLFGDHVVICAPDAASAEHFSLASMSTGTGVASRLGIGG